MKEVLKRVIKKPLYAVERQTHVWLPTGVRRPDFIGIGAGQAGSTWIFQNLQQHPSVYVCEKKETHYFNTAFNDWSFRYYCSLFEPAGERVCGEITPHYLLLTPQRIRTVRRLVPDARLLLTIRNPVDRAWSGARRIMSRVAQKMGIGFEDIPDAEFERFFEQEWAYRPRSAAAVARMMNAAGAYTPGMLQGHYTRAIDQWLEHFPEEQLLVIFFEEIAADPVGLMAKICEHIGAPSDLDWGNFNLSETVNKNPEHEIPERFRRFLTDLYAEEMKRLKRQYESQTAQW